LAPNKDELEWSSYLEAVLLIIKGKTFATASKVALVVGTILVGINQFDVLYRGKVGWEVILKIFLDYLVPYLVSSVGFLAPFKKTKSTQ
jgi:hypothetical protein